MKSNFRLVIRYIVMMRCVGHGFETELGMGIRQRGLQQSRERQLRSVQRGQGQEAERGAGQVAETPRVGARNEQQGETVDARSAQYTYAVP